MGKKLVTDGSLQKSPEGVSWGDLPFTVAIVFCFLIRDWKILLITRANEPYKGSRPKVLSKVISFSAHLEWLPC
jgi:hypothetical protein